MKKCFLLISLCVAMCACNENTFINEPVQENELVMSRSGETPSSDNYTVTPEMVCKYLYIARKGKTIDSLTPVIENGDTLAYVAQYTDSLGWDLISGDRRIPPVLANSNTGVLNLSDTINPAVGAVKGMIYTVKTIKESSETIKDPIWKVLEPKEKVVNNKPQARGIGFGKWIALDTTLETDCYTRPHIITTKWGQDHPWNTKTPRIQSVATKVGCVPVAAGQIIYHFRKNNYNGVDLPNNAFYTEYYYDTETGVPTFSNKSTEPWSNIKLNAQTLQSENDVTCVFLSYLGDQIGMNYGINGSTPLSDNIESVLLNVFKIESKRTSSFNFNQILANIKAGKPIYACFNGSNDGHAFIIDAYQHLTESMRVNYMWDPNYELQEGDEVVEPPMDASSSKDGYAYREEEISYYESYSLMMNWGWQGNYDNTSYLACTSSRWTMDESPVVRYYSPHWTVNGHTYSELNFLLYDLCDSE